MILPQRALPFRPPKVGYCKEREGGHPFNGSPPSIQNNDSVFLFSRQHKFGLHDHRIASDGRPIEVTDTPAGLSESAGIRNSIKQPVIRRDLERAGTEIYVLPQYKLTYDENGYCVKKEKCRIPDDIAAKLAEMNK